MDGYEHRLQSHAGLAEYIARLQRWACAPHAPQTGVPRERPHQLLEGLLLLLDQRFTDEEQQGCLADVQTAHPECAHAVARLVAQHRVLHERVRALMGEPEESPTFVARLRSVLHALSSHEARERRLLEDVECVDIGTGD